MPFLEQIFDDSTDAATNEIPANSDNSNILNTANSNPNLQSSDNLSPRTSNFFGINLSNFTTELEDYDYSSTLNDLDDNSENADWAVKDSGTFPGLTNGEAVVVLAALVVASLAIVGLTLRLIMAMVRTYKRKGKRRAEKDR